MKLQLLNPHRTIHRCDLCGATASLRECFLPYRETGRTDRPGTGKFYDLCGACRAGLSADPRPFVEPEDSRQELGVRACATPNAGRALVGAA